MAHKKFKESQEHFKQYTKQEKGYTKLWETETESYLLQGMQNQQGEVEIVQIFANGAGFEIYEPEAEKVTKLDGHEFIKTSDQSWGFLGRIYKGENHIVNVYEAVFYVAEKTEPVSAPLFNYITQIQNDAKK